MSDPRDFFAHITRRELEQVQRALLPGEDIYWGTRPVAAFWQHDTAAALFIGSLLLAFASLFVYGAFWAAEPAFHLLIIALSGFFGLALFTWPFRRWRRLKHTFYLVTTRRALVVAPSWGKWRTKAFLLDDYLLRWRRVQKDAQGDLVFNEESGKESASRVGFLHLPDAQLAERKLREALAFAKASRS